MAIGTQSTPQPYRLEGHWLLVGRLLYGVLMLMCMITFGSSLYAKFLNGTSDCDWLFNAEWSECNNWFATIEDLGITPVGFEGYFIVLRVVAGLPFLLLSVLLIRRRGEELRVLLLAGLLVVLAIAGTWFNPFWQWSGTWVPENEQSTILLWMARLLTFLLSSGLVLFIFMFPDGQFVPRWSRWVVGGWLILGSGVLFFPDSQVAYPNWPSDLWLIPTLTIIISGLIAIIWRYRWNATAVQRLQIKWISAGMMLMAANFILDYGVWDFYPAVADDWLITTGRQAVFWELGQDTLWYVSQFLFGVCLGFAVFRRQLWNIDPIINRTLLYIGLTALIVGLYILIVGGLGVVFQTQTTAISGLVATGIIAVLFQPLRDRLQRGVNRLLYGDRDDPAAVLTRLAHQLEMAETSAAILPNLVQTIAVALKIPYVAIWLPVREDQMEAVATAGESTSRVETIPLNYQGAMIGNLVVAPRSENEVFSRDEVELLATIATLTATTVRAVQLSDELRQSRQRIVTAREEERRRLRRDLHDGLGPQLASQTLGLEAIEQLLATNPAKVRELLGALKTQAQEAILDVRRLVYDLRPPTLDDLGLVGALRQSAARYEVGDLNFSFNIPNNLPELGAAVEIAIYRIAQEAMMNVVRHAKATTCVIGLWCEGEHFVIEVWDNGCGLADDYQSGVGLQAMKERAAELNGQCVIESSVGEGTKVRAQLPLGVDDE